MADTYQAKFEALVERERRATEQLQRQQEVSAVLFLKFLSVHCCAEIEMIMQLIWLVGWLVVATCTVSCSGLPSLTVLSGNSQCSCVFFKFEC